LLVYIVRYIGRCELFIGGRISVLLRNIETYIASLGGFRIGLRIIDNLSRLMCRQKRHVHICYLGRVSWTREVRVE
jgi:hypothetical protein